MNTDNPELIDNFEQFFKRYYSDEIAELAMNYPNEQRSLHVNYSDLYKYDSDLTDDYRNNPGADAGVRRGSTPPLRPPR